MGLVGARVGLAAAGIFLLLALALAPIAEATSSSRFRNPNTPRGSTAADPSAPSASVAPTEAAVEKEGEPGNPLLPAEGTPRDESLFLWLVIAFAFLFVSLFSRQADEAMTESELKTARAMVCLLDVSMNPGERGPS